MTSNIDPTHPVTGQALTANVRANFQAAYDEITALQDGVSDNVSILASMINADLTVAGDQTITMPNAPNGYIIKDIYITSADVINTGYLTICDQPDGQGTIFYQNGVNFPVPNGIMHEFGGSLDNNWLTQTTLYLNMNGPATAPALVNIYFIGFLL